MLGIPRYFGGYQGADIQIFRTTVSQTLGVNYWQTWHKQPGKTMLFVLGIGAGGGAGAGKDGAAASQRGGGGGGGCAAITNLLIPTIVLPDRLYVCVGMGGPGDSTGIGGTAGGITYVAVHPDTSSRNLLIRADAGGGGNAGAAGAGAASGGGAGAAVGISGCSIASLGMYQSTAGLAGANGGAATAAANQATHTTITQPGCGGSGVTAADTVGTTYTGPTLSWIDELISAAPAAGANPGSVGPALWPPRYPAFFFGGQGAAGSNNANAVAGGKGGIGSGGGGGGAGVTGGGKGRGGDGGDGLVIIVSW